MTTRRGGPVGPDAGAVLPRLLVASGAGHRVTGVATGLMAALAARGVTVSGHQAGPDPGPGGYHTLACGRPPRTLDPFLVGAPRVVPLLLHGAAGAQVAVIEGDAGAAAAAHVARLTATPVVLVVDCRGPVAPAPGVAGVILTHVTSSRRQAPADATLRAVGVPVLGALPSGPALPDLPAVDAVAELGATVAEHVDLDAILALAAAAEPLPGPAWNPAGHLPPAPGRVVAVAGGPVCTFSHTETVELLEAAGSRVRVFDPGRDPELPEDTGAVLLGAVFPQLPIADLSANVPLRESIARFAAAGGPVQAEGAGFAYLCRAVDGLPMCGVVPAVVRATGHLTRGYRKAADRCTGHKVTGHECHRTATVHDDPHRPAAWQWTDDHGQIIRDGYKNGLLAAGNLHVHPAGHPWRLRFD